MKWRGRRRSLNVRDLRNTTARAPRMPRGTGRGFGRGGFGRGGFGRGGLGRGGIGPGMRLPRGRTGLFLVIAVVAIFWLVEQSGLLSNIEGQNAPIGQGAPSAADDDLSAFISVVLADTEDAWTQLFRQEGRRYDKPTLVLFSGAVDSACGFAQSATGPFYCPADQQIYIDLSFYQDLRNKLGAPGDFAQAYVIAHEVAHHVQTLLGISGEVQAERRRASQAESNALSVRLELQADCFAGVWAHVLNAQGDVIEDGDIDEALNAASAIGDDRLQGRGGGRVVPDSFTHGSSAQRVSWFRRGLDSGDTESCDTFSAARL